MDQTVIVITGGTRGIGRGLALAFLQRQCRLVICGRDGGRLEQTLIDLNASIPGGAERLHGQLCDVADAAAVQALWEAAIRRFGRVDIWINNAAIGSHEVDFWRHDPVTIDTLIRINLLGTMHGCRAAVRGMLAQGYGHIYTLEGWGSGGERRRGSTLYGASKAAVRYFTKSLAAELRGTPVKLSSLNPGVVPTDLLALSIRPEQARQIRSFINMFGDKVETVAPALADQVLHNQRHGARIQWLPPRRMLGRLLQAPFRRRQVIDPTEKT